ncbi:MAG: hypothetical protein J6T32_03805 [Paludibacteraceae bacterium]|nr:hypothetical protein [Paludibacteraceae bacterium]
MKRILIVISLVMGVSSFVLGQDTILPYPIDTINGTAVYRYTPEKSIGLYRISVNFGLPMGEIVQWNPQLEKRGPQLTDVLLIPVKQTIARKVEVVPVVEPSPVAVVPEKPILPQEEPVSPTIRDTSSIVTLQAGKIIRLAVVLPFNAKAVTREATDDRFYDFYAGVLLAIRQAEMLGQQFEIHTYDLSRTDNRLLSLTQDSFIHNADAIIGPVYAPQVEAMVELTQSNPTLILAPFASSIPSIDKTDRLLQFNPTSQLEAEVMAEYLNWHKDSLQCLVIKGTQEDMSASVRDIYNELNQRNIPVVEVPLQAILNDSLAFYADEQKTNLFIFHSDRYSHLNILMPHLYKAAESNNLVLLSHYSWDTEPIHIPRLFTSVFHPIQEDSLAVEWQLYQQNYSRYFGHPLASIHPRFDLLGFDLTRHLVLILQELQDIADPVYRDHILTQPYSGIQENIIYQRQQEGGYINRSISVIHK